MLQPDAEFWPAEGLVAWGRAQFAPELAIASSFGAEDVVLIDLAARAGGVRVFTLDTDFLFPQTYELIARIESHYGLKVERCRSALTPSQQAAEHGEALWASRPDQCCNLRKVEPLTEKLGTLRAWITGIRRDQAPTRAAAQKVEWDARFGLVKLNPLADWTWSDVWQYIHDHDVPYNPLHDSGYPSIGCTYCTRAVAPGEDLRSGRWAGTGKTECGLHVK
ncbi:MAG TPA: phosphoadenylyl-sulfate reductase [Thermoanaerobaculia bacterium]